MRLGLLKGLGVFLALFVALALSLSKLLQLSLPFLFAGLVALPPVSEAPPQRLALIPLPRLLIRMRRSSGVLLLLLLAPAR